MKRPLAILSLLAALTASAAPAAAQPKSPPRAVPDYDGRPEAPETVGHALLVIPRVLLAPLYFVSEFLLRRPFEVLIKGAEKGQWLGELVDFFTFGTERNIGIVPTAFVDFGFRTSVGIYAFWNDAFAKGNDLRLHAATGGADYLTESVADRIHMGNGRLLTLHESWTRRSDYVFYGAGPRSLQSGQSRYAADIFDAGPVLDVPFGDNSSFHATVGVRDVRFKSGTCCEDPFVLTRASEGAFAPPPGFGDGYTIVYKGMEVAFDTRPQRLSNDPTWKPRHLSGLRLQLEGEHDSDIKASHAWIRYGGTVGAFVDVWHERVVSLTVTTLFAEPVSHDTTIPFTEQIVLGGSGPMRGFRPGRLVDRSAAVAALTYSWPIWAFLDGAMNFSLGNVFGSQLKDFSPKLLRMSGGLGLRTNSSPDHQFEMLVGFGSETFDQGAKISSFRFVVGGTKGF